MLIFYSFIFAALASIDYERQWLMKAVHMYCFDDDDSIISARIKEIACNELNERMDKFTNDYDFADTSTAWQHYL